MHPNEMAEIDEPTSKKDAQHRTYHIHLYTILIMLKLLNNSKRDTQIMRAILIVAIITISFSLLSYVLFVSLQSFISVEAQNLTNIIQTNNNSESQIYIPPTISKGAQEILKKLTMNLPTFTFVTPN